MPKLKSHKGLSKRVKVTASGKVKRKKAFSSHLMSTKNAKRRRHLGQSSLISNTVLKKLKVLISS